MEKPKDLLCIEGISCMTFNKDFSSTYSIIFIIVCCLSRKDNNLYIYKTNTLTDPSSWELIYTLKSVIFNLIYFSIYNIFQVLIGIQRQIKLFHALMIEIFMFGLLTKRKTNGCLKLL